MLINRNNFLVWDNGSPASTSVMDLPEGYIRDPARCGYAPLLIPGEALRFYINADATLTGSAGSIDLINAQTGEEITGIGTANMDIYNTDTSAYTFYGEVVIDSTVLPGVYYLRINSTPVLTSNNVRVMLAASDYRNYSCLCTFRHDRFFYGFNYQSLTDFTQQYRLHFNEIDMQPESNKDVYNEVTTGKQRTYNEFKKRVRKLEAYYFDKYAHEAADVMFDHSDLSINGKPYVAKNEYKILRQVLNKHYKGEIELYDEDFATANRCTVAAEIIEPPPPPVCIAAAISGSPTLPDGQIDVPWSASILIAGTEPFTLANFAGPSWMDEPVVDGDTVELSGTPDTVDSDIPLSFDIENDCGSDSFAGTFTIIDTPPPPPTGFACGDSFGDTYADPDYHNYSFYYLDTTTGSPSTMFINWTCYDRPNRFALYDETTNTLVSTTGWVGNADYTGPWGTSLHTPNGGYFTFNPVAGHTYKIQVETGPAATVDPQEDTWDISLTCV